MDNIGNINKKRQEGAMYFTKIKFERSEETGAVVGYVFKKPTGQLIGVRRESKYPKKVCMVDKSIAGDILLNVLYDCTLIRMNEKNGYVVIKAVPVQFKTEITTTYIKNNDYRVSLKFGNKTIIFDPYRGKKETTRNLKSCLEMLSRRLDIANILQVLSDFELAGNKILTLMERDKYNAEIK